MRYRLGRLIVALGMFVAASAEADEPRAPERLRIATWDIAEATAAGVLKLPEENKPVWRTTFGAERRTEVKPSFDPTNIDADVLLLQGVTSVRDLRRFFPARAWRILVSRQILSAEAAANGNAQNPTTGPVTPTTAIAVRLRKGMRIATQEHLLALAEATPGAKSPPAAGLAVRLINHGRTVWVASAALDPGCTSPTANCPATQVLANWMKGKSEAADQTVVVGGRLQRTTAAKAPEPTAQKPAPTPPPAKAVEAKPSVAQPPPAPSENPSASSAGWLTGWFGFSASKAQPPKPEERLIAEAKPAPTAPPTPSTPKQPAAPPQAAPEPPTAASPAEGSVARKIERDGNKMRLADTDSGNTCPNASIAISLAGDGHVRSADTGFAQQKNGCLVMVDLSVEPAPPPPPEQWPEITEPPSGTADPSTSPDDAG